MPLGVDERFDALKSGKIDVLAHNTTWTMSREAEFGLTFVGVNYYDGQGFLVHKSPEIASALELDGVKVCVQKGTTTIDNFEDYFKSNNLKFEAVEETSQDDAAKAELFPCLGIAPLHVDAHSEEDGWGELRVLVHLLRRRGDPAPIGHGLTRKGGLRLVVGRDGAEMHPIGTPIPRIVVRRGKVVDGSPLLPPKAREKPRSRSR